MNRKKVEPILIVTSIVTMIANWSAFVNQLKDWFKKKLKRERR